MTCAREEDSVVCSTHHTHLPKHTTAHTHNHCAVTGAANTDSISDDSMKKHSEKNTLAQEPHPAA